MISELVLIRSYSTFWKSLFPGGEDYIKLINTGLGKKVNETLEIADKPHRRALLNSISFSLFEKYIKKEISFEEYISLEPDSLILTDIAIFEKRRLINSRFGKDLSSKISIIDFKLIKWISDSLIKTYSKVYKRTIRPKFKGCGILFEAEGDIFYYNTLAEIKAGDRNFGIHDIRQLYVYLALNNIDPNYEINKIELYNPRTGILWNERVDVVSENIAGTPTIEILYEIISFISNENRSL